ncbi:type II toxin-antitoxin system HicB family antitoxin [Paenibacillus lautus]|uniref:type II toxin-antitoxin system HicB family antitoxin n=1 Tax=Paenibacillus lautus TaxID=1401 RepID=UPI003D2D854D
MKDHYAFPAIFHHGEDGISVSFPDVPGALTFGQNYEEAILMAKDCLGLHLYGMESDNDPIPAPRPLLEVETQPNELLALIDVWMPLYRDIDNKAVKVTTTIPSWLKKIATENNFNYSYALQVSIKKMYGITDRK